MRAGWTKARSRCSTARPGRAAARPVRDSRPLECACSRRSRPARSCVLDATMRRTPRSCGNAVPKEPLLFLKPPSSLIANGDAIVLPAMSERVEHEAELGVVIGARLRDASPDEARRAIFGVTCVNDVTARDLQKRDVQFTRAKSFDTFCPVGPVDRDRRRPDEPRRHRPRQWRRAPARQHARHGVSGRGAGRVHLADHDAAAGRPASPPAPPRASARSCADSVVEIELRGHRRAQQSSPLRTRPNIGT